MFFIEVLIMWVIGLLIAGIIIAVILRRGVSDGYNSGSGMFKNSDMNLDHNRKNFDDVEYYDNPDIFK